MNYSAIDDCAFLEKQKIKMLNKLKKDISAANLTILQQEKEIITLKEELDNLKNEKNLKFKT